MSNVCNERYACDNNETKLSKATISRLVNYHRYLRGGTD